MTGFSCLLLSTQRDSECPLYLLLLGITMPTAAKVYVVAVDDVVDNVLSPVYAA